MSAESWQSTTKVRFLGHSFAFQDTFLGWPDSGERGSCLDILSLHPQVHRSHTTLPSAVQATTPQVPCLFTHTLVSSSPGPTAPKSRASPKRFANWWFTKFENAAVDVGEVFRAYWEERRICAILGTSSLTWHISLKISSSSCFTSSPCCRWKEALSIGKTESLW